MRILLAAALAAFLLAGCGAGGGTDIQGSAADAQFGVVSGIEAGVNVDSSPSPSPDASPEAPPLPETVAFTIVNEAGVPQTDIDNAIEVVSRQFANDWTPAYGPTVIFGEGGYLIHLVAGGGSYHTADGIWVDVAQDLAEWTLPLSHEAIEFMVDLLGYDYQACDGAGWYNIGGPAGWPVAHFWLPGQTAINTPSDGDQEPM